MCSKGLLKSGGMTYASFILLRASRWRENEIRRIENLRSEARQPIQRAQIKELDDSSSALKEHLGTHATLVDPTSETYSCTYPNTQTQEYYDRVIEKAKSLGINQEPMFARMTKV
ncbi:uncharacterized protein A4U43_C04F23100 [Asparagus officinalis]|uniref:Uncharacterized protein n=1 Tax=Asparagus officinalis TaxID=4686 RepID=A0A5P1F5T8_ASPOF|nr:uncharacterized protein A4U43_C04F23100 [Asparagus officinalis]